MPGPTRVLIVTADVLGAQMAGPAIRALEMAKALAGSCAVRLVSTVEYGGVEHNGFEACFADEDQLRAHAEWCEVVVIQGHVLASFPWLASESRRLVADIYDPLHLEVLEQGKDLVPKDRLWLSLDAAEVLNEQIRKSDFMLCASEKQRDLWLGQLAGLARINPASYDQDNSLRMLLDVAPFGIGEEPPVQRAHGIKGTVPGIGASDKVILWGGGIYNWFDPITLIEAVARLAPRHPELRLFFMGVAHPNPNVPTMTMAVRARALAEELGLLGTVVFFNEGWVPYDERADFLLDADLGVSTHLDHIETAFSFRTRILDYLWASLPIVASDGDTFAQLVRERELGRVVPPQDVEALAAALDDVLFTPGAAERISANVAAYARTVTWSQVLAPLVRYCAQPWRAADLAAGIHSVRTQHIMDLNKRIAGLENSSSWRITRPLRWLIERAVPGKRADAPTTPPRS